MLKMKMKMIENDAIDEDDEMMGFDVLLSSE